ncbi:MAG: hypothetical protein BYD32DRAFT_43849 [Podila humilis]|nr:MAG: hypothetical protein BYD32DRAFT_43849 [Podila humilis]
MACSSLHPSSLSEPWTNSHSDQGHCHRRYPSDSGTTVRTKTTQRPSHSLQVNTRQPTAIYPHYHLHSHSHSHSHSHPHPHAHAHTFRSKQKSKRVAITVYALGSILLSSSAAAVTPTWRAFHGAAIIDTSMVIFGGTTDSSLNPYGATVPGSNDLWVWSTTLRTWSQPLAQFAGTSNNAPAPQKFLSSVALQSQGKMMSLVSNNTPGVTPGNLLMLDTNFWGWSIPNSRKQDKTHTPHDQC